MDILTAARTSPKDRREYWHETDVLVIDEAHTQHRAWVDYIKTTKDALEGTWKSSGDTEYGVKEGAIDLETFIEAYQPVTP